MEDHEIKTSDDESTDPRPEKVQQEDSPAPDEAKAESTDEKEITEPSMKETEPSADDHIEEASAPDEAKAESTDENEITEPSMKVTEPSADDHVEEEPVQNESADSDDINKVSSMDFEQFPKTQQTGAPHNIDMLLDVALPISIELGRTHMPIQDILKLGPGSVVELSKLAGEPVDLLVNNKMIARGEVVIVDENFGIRVTSMVSQEDRIKSLG